MGYMGESNRWRTLGFMLALHGVLMRCIFMISVRRRQKNSDVITVLGAPKLSSLKILGISGDKTVLFVSSNKRAQHQGITKRPIDNLDT